MSTRESFGSTMDVILLNKLRELSKETGIPISKLLDRAVQLLINDKDGYINGLSRNDLV